MLKSYSFIGGKWIKSINSKKMNSFNPGNLDEKIGEVDFANSAIVETAVDISATSFKKWRYTSIEKRTELVNELITKIKINENKLVEIITRENGKTLRESFAEVHSGLNEAHFQVDFLSKSLTENINNFEIHYEPLGIVLLITPWNFPIATVLRKMIPALMVGNTIILKPSEFTSLTAALLFSLIEEVNFPIGVINLVLGDGEIGSILSSNPKIKAISMTGSTKTGYMIKKQIVQYQTKFQAEMGGKNCVAVLPDTNINIVAQDIIRNGYACCGQWCTGTSKVIAHQKIYYDLLDRMIELTKEINVGNGMEETTDMGPLISETQLNKVRYAIQKSGNAKLLIGGKQPIGEQSLNGYYFEPTIFSDVDPESFLAQEEIFGPVLSIIKCTNINEILKTVNNSKYGLSFSVYTKEEELAEKFIREVESGLCHINLPTAYRDHALPLLGWKNSGFGLPESGRFTLDFFSNPKAIYRNL